MTDAAAPQVERLNLRTLLEEMIERDASDLHITAGERPKLRIDGEITNAKYEAVLTPKETLQVAYSVLTENQKKRFEMEDELDFSFGIQDLARFRGNCFKQRGCVSLVIRQIPIAIKTFEELGLPNIIDTLSKRPRGLVLVTGPTGSGKSTTLAAMIDRINRQRRAHIITIEDPIEVVHKSDNCLVNQREVGSHAPAFSTALRSVLREDPDVILIGEMRDLETISFAVTAAETGHLVFATVHTVSADKCVDRIINAFPAVQQPQVRGMLSETLRAVVCQHLLRKRDRSGRVLAVEVMLGNEAIKALIRKGKAFQIPSVIATHTDKGMQLMDHQLARLVKDKVVAYEEAYMRAVDKADFERRVGDREDEEPLYAPPEEDDRASSVPSDAPPRTSLPPATPPPHSMPRPKSASTQRDSKPDRDESLRAGSGKPTAESDKPRDSRVPLKSGIPRATTSGAYSHTVPPSSRRGGSGGGKGS